MANLSKLTIEDIQYIIKDTEARTQLGSKAPLASPALTGIPTAPTAETGTNTTQIATTAFVISTINESGIVADAMVFKGTIGSDGATVSSLPDNHTKGWTYKVATAGTYAGHVCEVGDVIICTTNGKTANNAHWTVVQSNIDGAVVGPASSTAEHVASFSGATGKIIKDSGYTIAKSVPSDAKFTDTTYSSKTAASGGSDESLVTTGEKYTWNNKLNANQGSGNAGKFMVVNSSGIIEPVAMASWQGGSY